MWLATTLSCRQNQNTSTLKRTWISQPFQPYFNANNLCARRAMMNPMSSVYVLFRLSFFKISSAIFLLLLLLAGLSYKLYRLAGVPAPRANLARVAVGIVESISGKDGDASGGGNQDRTPPTYTYLNYLNLQTINDQAFLKENFVDFQNNGTLWGMHKPYSNRLGAHRYALNKCGDDDPVDMFTCDQGCSSDDAEAGNTGDAAGGVTLDAVPAEDQLLQQLVDVSGACYASSVKLTAFLEQMATPAYIKSMATDAMLSNWDGFCGVLNGHGNNYLLYHDTAGFRKSVQLMFDLFFGLFRCFQLGY